MSLSLTMSYVVTEAQAAAASSSARLFVRGNKYVFDAGQGALAKALTTYREDIENELDVVTKLHDLAPSRGKHDPADVFAIAVALRDALDADGDLVVKRVAELANGGALFRKELLDLEAFARFGIAHGLVLSHSFG